MNRRDFIKVISALPAIGAAGGFSRKPNFVFFLADDLGWADTGYNGSRFYETPAIDRMAAEGMVFTDAYAACPVCSPTRASIMTGKYPARIGITNFIGGFRKGKIRTPENQSHLPLEEATIGEALAAAGYHNYFIGKWHLGGKGYLPDRQGFEVNIAGGEAGMPVSGYFSPYHLPNLEDGPRGEYLTDRLTGEAIQCIEKAGDEPIFVYLSHYAVHVPIQAKKEMIARFKEKKAGDRAMPWEEFARRDGRWTRVAQDDATYAAMLKSLDESLGRMMDAVERAGQADNTVFIFMSDNGGLATAEGWPTSNLPLRGGKGWLYEGGIREPMIIKWPGVTKAGSRCAEPVTSTDFYPTMLEMAGLPLMPEQHMDGVSLAPLLKGEGALERDAVFWHYPHYSNQGGKPSAAVRMGDWKLIEFFEDGRTELFNLRDDISETRDLSSSQPEKRDELKARLHAWFNEVHARMPG